MTRNAFKGTLEIDNNSTAGPIQGVQVDLEITDANGISANDKFGITGPILSGLSGVDGSGIIATDSNGTAIYTFIPNRDAAPVQPTVYRIGGTLRYISPETGQEITVPLFPSTITVYPDAQLELDYFQQRDVIGDDPFTAEAEASEQFTLGLLVHNTGHGTAQDLTITSAQPKIIENEKGLLIDFQIVGTQVGGQSVAPSLTADLGDIAPGQTQEARWLLTSSLQGRFVDYTATFEHVNGLGDSRLSLIDKVNIHELIHTVRADRPGDDSLYDFLVNDEKDTQVLPDTLYLSDGTTAVVNVADAVSVDHTASLSNLEVNLSANMTSGWCYLRIDDPGAGYKLSKVVRSDGKEIVVGDNAWQTDYVFAETNQSYLREERLHLLDYNSTGSYTLFYVLDDSIAPELTTINQVTPNPATGPVSSIDVTFSESINLATFNYQDVTLTRNGGANLIDSNVTVALVSGSTYRIGNLAALTGADGNYQLTVNAGSIQDFGANNGSNTLSTSWAKGTITPVVVSVGDGMPSLRNSQVDSIDVVFSKSIDASSFGIEDVCLTRNGSVINLSGLSIQALDATSFRLSGLGALTTPEGTYALTINGSGVADTNGAAGIGTMIKTWTMDTTAPTSTGITHLATNPRNIVVPTLDVTFSEQIQASSFDWHDISLARDGGSNLITNAVTVQKINDTTYRISNFNWVVGQEGTYTLNVSLAGILDLAGNAGTGSVAEAWVMDTTKPLLPANLHIAPDLGVSNTDGLTNTLNLSIQGELPESGLMVEVTDTTSNTLLAAQRMDSTVLNLPITLATVGRHQLKLRLVDQAGNVVETTLNVFIDLTAPTLQGFTGVPAGIATSPLHGLDIVLSEAIDPATLSIDDLSLTHDGLALDLSGAQLITTDGITFHLTNLSVPAQADGSYVLSLSLAGITDRAGNSGTGQTTTTWQVGISDTSRPTVTNVVVQNGQGMKEVNTFAVTFSEAMNIQAMINDGSIIHAVSLARLDANGTHVIANIAFNAAQFSYDAQAHTLTWNLNGVSGETQVLPTGRYEIQLDYNKFTDLAGNTLQGNGGGVTLLGLPDFEAATNIQSGGTDIQAAAYSVPTLADWNGDGRADLIVGEQTTGAGKVRVYLNAGTNTTPVFNGYSYIQTTSGDLTVPASGCLGAFPRVVDWNQDGKQDLLVGLADGTIEAFLNTGTATLPILNAGTKLQAGSMSQKADLNVGARAAFDMADWNNDGLSDLVVGGLDGKVRVYLNQGTPIQPDLAGAVIVQEGTADLTVSSGRASVSVFDLDHDGRKDLILGNTDGQLVLYRNTGADTSPVFESHEFLKAEGAAIDLIATRSREFVCDFNGDGVPDILIGASDGQVRIYAGHVASENYFTQFNVVNTPPTATADSYTITEDTTPIIPVAGVLANDSDIDGDTLNAILVTGPTHGSLTLHANGSFIYTPTANYNGTDSFTYVANDGAISGNEATVTITINPVNDGPTGFATASLTAGTEDTAYVVSAADLLNGFSDVDGDTLSVTGLVANHGPVTDNGNGTFTISPALNYNGPVNLSYSVTDGKVGTVAGSQSFTLAAMNDAPTGIATASLPAGAEDTAYIVSATDLLAGFSDVDGDTLSVTDLVADHGTVIDNGDGAFTITPTLNFNGPVNLSYNVVDGQGGTVAGSQSFTLAAMNGVPVGVNDTASGNEDTVISGNVLTNDSDPNGDTLSAILVAGPSHGSLTLNANGSFTYTPTANFYGTDSFTYKANDGIADSNTATVSITVAPKPLLVTSAVATSTGIRLIFNHALDTNTLNLYGLSGTVADLSLVGASTGTVKGSFMVEDSGKALTFIKTGGVLAADVYTLTLRSAADGFRDSEGRLLDGNSDGTAGDNFTTTFTVGATTRTLSIPDFARGPGQAVDVKAADLNSDLPIRLSNGSGITQVSFTLRYDPSLLTISNVQRGNLPTGATLSFTNDTATGALTVQINSTTALSATTSSIDLVKLTTSVPSTATYRDKQILNLTNLSLNNGTVAVTDDDGFQLVAYLGDTTGNKVITSNDYLLVPDVAVRRSSGFAAYASVDPTLIADINGNGAVDATDALLISNEAKSYLPGYSSSNRPEIPDLPAGVTAAEPVGPDPFVSIPTSLTARQGELVTVPVLVDPADGLSSAQISLAYDPSVLELVEVRRGDLTQDFGIFLYGAADGLLKIDMNGGAKTVNSGTGSIALAVFRVIGLPATGSTAMDLQWVNLNDGQMVLTPVPVPGEDATDGRLTVTAAAKQIKQSVVAVPGRTAQTLHEAGADLWRKLVTPSGATPSNTTSGLIQWSTAPAEISPATTKVPKSTAQGWMATFATTLAEEVANPNNRIKVTLPNTQREVGGTLKTGVLTEHSIDTLTLV